MIELKVLTYLYCMGPINKVSKIKRKGILAKLFYVSAEDLPSVLRAKITQSQKRLSKKRIHWISYLHVDFGSSRFLGWY